MNTIATVPSTVSSTAPSAFRAATHAPQARRVSTADRGPRYRLTRRGRLVVLVVGLLAVLAVGVALASASMATQEPGDPDAVQRVVVGPGDTLWAIASEAADGDDVRDMVARIEELNGLESGMVASGQRLLVPTD